MRQLAWRSATSSNNSTRSTRTRYISPRQTEQSDSTADGNLAFGKTVSPSLIFSFARYPVVSRNSGDSMRFTLDNLLWAGIETRLSRRVFSINPTIKKRVTVFTMDRVGIPSGCPGKKQHASAALADTLGLNIRCKRIWQGCAALSAPCRGRSARGKEPGMSFTQGVVELPAAGTPAKDCDVCKSILRKHSQSKALVRTSSCSLPFLTSIRAWGMAGWIPAKQHTFRLAQHGM